MMNWGQYPEAAVFDEWLANLDRNYSNMLFRANVIWLIDHADALGGTAGALYPLTEIARMPFANQLLDDIKNDFTDKQRHSFMAIAKEVFNSGQRIRFRLRV